MFVVKPHIFNQSPEITAGVSTKTGLQRESPYYFNLSYSVGDDKKIVDENRQEFFKYLGLDTNNVAYQLQIHSDIFQLVGSAGNCGESDALITNKKGLGLAVSIADCTPVLIYDSLNKVIAAVHAGWRGAKQKIVTKVISHLVSSFNSKPNDLYVYLGPSISQANYEVGEEVAKQFDKKFILKTNNKYFLDVAESNYNELINFNIPENNIQKSELCTYEMNNVLHSYRRDGIKSGRSLAVIAMKKI